MGSNAPDSVSQAQQLDAIKYSLRGGRLIPLEPGEDLGFGGLGNTIRVNRDPRVPEGVCEELVRAMHSQLRLPSVTYEVKPGEQGRHEAYVHGQHIGPVLVGDMVRGLINFY